jgi:hypothetical protein
MSTIVEPKISLDSIPLNWRTAPKRWGSPLHSMCSYFAMFPPRLAHYLIAWLTEPGDAVYDPFSGRGTTGLEAIMLGRRTYASDLNPMAAVLTQAKLNIPTEALVIRRLKILETLSDKAEMDLTGVPEDISMLYSSQILKQLVFLKNSLDKHNYIDNFILAAAMGKMHANHNKGGKPRGFSISMPNTFAMSPTYVRKYIHEHGLVRPEFNIFDMLREQVERFELPLEVIHGGRSWTQDATVEPPPWLKRDPVKLVLTSPPYLEVIKYGKYNWVRLWLLGEQAKDVDDKLMASGSMSRYIEFMSDYLKQMRKVVADDGYICLVIGDVRRKDEHLNLAEAVWELAAKPQGWYLHSIIADELPAGVKVSRIWKNNIGRATKTDRLLLMSPHKVELPQTVSLNWDKPSFRN